jgi:hypothetical protein
MVERSIIVAALVAALTSCGSARAGEPGAPPTPAEIERDRLIALITRGSDIEGNAKKFALLLQERDRTVATSAAAVAAEKSAREAERAWRKGYEKTADYDLGWRCTASVDPQKPVPSVEGRFFADWGRVVKKESVRLAPKNALDEGEPATLYEVAGQVRHYYLRGEKFGPGSPARDLTGNVGDWMLVCDGDGGSSDRTERRGWRGSADDPSTRVPEYWRGKLQRHGFAAAVTAPPKITQKGRWNPIHITSTNYFWAIHDVKWKYPPGKYVLTNLELSRQVDGRWEVSVEHNLSFLIEVPPSLPRKEVLQPGHRAWIIMGEPRFDATLHKLVLVAADVEATYVTEK